MHWKTEMLDMSSRVKDQNSMCVDDLCLPQDVLWAMDAQWLLDANSEKMVKRHARRQELHVHYQAQTRT